MWNGQIIQIHRTHIHHSNVFYEMIPYFSVFNSKESRMSSHLCVILFGRHSWAHFIQFDSTSSFSHLILSCCLFAYTVVCVCVSLFERHNFSEIFIVRHKYKMQLNVRDSTKSSICEHILFRILCEWNQWRKIKEAQTLTLTHISRNWLTATDDTCHNNATVVQKYTNGILFVA